MRHLVSSFIALAMLGAGAAQATPDPTPEAKLAHLLGNRVAGKPVDCLYQYNIRSSQIIDHTAILYEMNDGTYYLNRPRSGASSLRWSNVLVTDTHSPQLCSIDVVWLYDTSPWMQTGSVGLGDFVPYAKVRTPHSE